MDPWSWSVDDVISNLCYSTEIWSNRQNPWLNRPGDLESILVSNPIDGPTLLLDVNHTTLKDDLGIVALRERSALLWLIDELRDQSPQYLSHQRSVHERNAHISNLSSSFSPFSASHEALSHSVQSPAPSIPAPLEPNLSPQSSLLAAPNVRPGEVIIDGPRGKKRKLVLQNQTVNKALFETPLPQDPRTYHLSPTQDPFSDVPEHAYIGKQRMELDEILYGKCKIGDRLDQVSENDDHDNFSFVFSKARADGRRRVVYNCVTRSMRGDTRMSGGTLLTYPYPTRLVKPENPVSATLYDLTSIRRVDAITPYASYDGENQKMGTSEWDYLASRYQPVEDDEGLPLYGDSDPEITDSDPDLDDESNQVNPITNVDLTEEKVATVIDDCVKAFEQQWKDTKFPSFERKAPAMWRDGRSNLGNARAHLIAVEKRLGNIRKHIQKDSWTSETTLRRQCHSLEQTVFAIQELKFKIRLWQQARPPQRPERNIVVRKAVPKWLVEHESEGDDVESEPDEEDNFIDCVHEKDGDVKQEPPEEPLTLALEDTLDDQNRTTHENIEMASVHHDSNAGGGQGCKDELIDLTMSDDEPAPEDDIFNTTRDALLGLSWITIEQSGNRKQLILKLLCSMEPKVARGIVKRALLDKFDFFSGDLKLGLRYVRQRTIRAPGQEDEVFTKCINQARAYLCWAVVDHTLWHGEVPNHILESVSRSLSAKPYHDFMCEISLKGMGLFGQTKNSDTDHDSVDLQRAPRMNKRPDDGKAKDRKGKDLQLAAKRRREIGVARHLQLESSGLDETSDKIMINTYRSGEEDPIYIDPQISSRMKPHQIEGVRFMWREVIVSGEDDSGSNQGCLLAHTMGLGKTMQAITLLATINKVLQSTNAVLRRQIPKMIRRRPFRALIICPPGLIDNWKDELTMWLPKSDGTVIYELSARIPREDRPNEISEWFNNGGILLSGMELFRRYAPSNTNTIGNSSNAPSHESAEDIANSRRLRRFLLEGPRIVIADEAHKLRNVSTGVGAAVMQFKTPSRIALTGSPLANNLLDYWAMINWVAEGYLGPMSSFKGKYQNPIEAGIYADSLPIEQRLALKKLQALKRTIEPKVHRADITVLSGSLPPKTEFVVKIPLTRLQTKAYQCFVESLMKGNVETVANTRLFNWLNVLALLCAHPVIFLAKIAERKAAKDGLVMTEPRMESPSDKDTVTAEDAATVLNKVDINVNEMDLSEDMIQSQRQMFEEEAAYVGDDSLQLSFKTKIIFEIITQAMQLGDRVLIFSHYLPTLNFLERTVMAIPHIKAVRIDGSIQGDDRARTVKEFNAGRYNVMLISTRAGGLGLNIPGANRVVLADFHFNPSWEEQAVGRVYRMGQTKPVYVYHLVTGGTFEETIHQRTIFKRQLAFRVVDKKQPVRAASKIKDFLFPPREIPKEDVTPYLGKDIIMDRLIVMDAAVRSLSTTEVLHKESNEALTEEEMKEVDLMVQSEKMSKKMSSTAGPSAHVLDQFQLNQQLNDLGYSPEARATLQQKHPGLFLGSTAPRISQTVSVGDQRQGAVNVKDINPLSADIEMAGTVEGLVDTTKDGPPEGFSQGAKPNGFPGKQAILPGILEAAENAKASPNGP